MGFVSVIGTGVACCGLLFFLACVGLVFWYLLKQNPQEVSANAPEPPIASSIEHPTAGTPEPEPEPSPWSPPPAPPQPSSESAPAPSETPGADV